MTSQPGHLPVPPGSVADLAETIKAEQALAAKVRIAVITAIDTVLGRRVQTDQTGSGWIARSEDTFLNVGDRVWLLQQGGTFIVGGRLSGEPGGIPIGAIMPFAGSTPPPGWLKCDGSAISRVTYSQLYAVTGNGYGAGDGSSTFNLPNLAGRFPLGEQGLTWFQTSTGGADEVTLTTGQIPAHTHGSAGAHTHTYDPGSVSTRDLGDFTAHIEVSDVQNTGSSGTHTHASVGSGLPHENMPPYLVILYIIRVL